MIKPKKVEVPKVPEGEQYEPAAQLKKAKKKGVASTEQVVENIIK